MSTYNKINKMLKTIHHESSKLELWHECCNELGFQRVKKGSEQYDKVKELYEIKRAQNLSPNLKKWLQAQEEAGLKGVVVRKGSPEYDMILERYREKN